MLNIWLAKDEGERVSNLCIYMCMNTWSTLNHSCLVLQVCSSICLLLFLGKRHGWWLKISHPSSSSTQYLSLQEIKEELHGHVVYCYIAIACIVHMEPHSFAFVSVHYGCMGDWGTVLEDTGDPKMAVVFRGLLAQTGRPDRSVLKWVWPSLFFHEPRVVRVIAIWRSSQSPFPILVQVEHWFRVWFGDLENGGRVHSSCHENILWDFMCGGIYGASTSL